MSSRSVRPPLRGVIYQGDTIVGGVDLNAAGEPFIAQFNREYARLGLRVAPCVPSSGLADAAEHHPLTAASGDVAP